RVRERRARNPGLDREVGRTACRPYGARLCRDADLSLGVDELTFGTASKGLRLCHGGQAARGASEGVPRHVDWTRREDPSPLVSAAGQSRLQSKRPVAAPPALPKPLHREW